jgi:hypothetical protein
VPVDQKVKRKRIRIISSGVHCIYDRKYAPRVYLSTPVKCLDVTGVYLNHLQGICAGMNATHLAIYRSLILVLCIINYFEIECS